ncbi:thiamine-phosphate kinase [Nitrosovibrio sp. Nv17]|uniref:thiamine-phosphate kinase n=1 Tax=Nitrosovibrio sp. Nv17 TaxID=1855339 RepID=UPI000908B57F|nr:thiamine-phosphate kinase [Nitrosovibrio sp. Nv17]SFW22961.1 thiamine-phosphate kinase [Nitrosovibrio sp. Nv17]
MPGEFDIIRRHFSRPAPGAILGAGDDAALIRPGEGMELAVSADMLVSGRHFFEDAAPYGLGCKSLAVNLSDLAAMGATPRWAVLSLVLPDVLARAGDDWLAAFAEGFFALAREHEVDLVGGDTTAGPLAIGVTLLGEVASGRALRRSGAKPGDDVWVSGRLGDAALALAHLQGRLALEPDEAAACLQHLHTPVARVRLGQALLGLATSAIDVSDGLLADLGHILDRSAVTASLHLDDIPCSAAMRRRLPQPLALDCLLAGGDDYELCFTAPVSERGRVEALSGAQALPLARIGTILERNESAELIVLDASGHAITPSKRGYDHFRD